MGGKQWSPEEERIFWTIIVPRSDKRLGIHRALPMLSWEELAGEMDVRMAQMEGFIQRREYTQLTLCMVTLSAFSLT
jgi:hypothetical protein